MTTSASSGKPVVAVATRTRAQRLVAALMVVTGVLTFAYAAISLWAAPQVVKQTPLGLVGTPAIEQLDYRDVVFPAREDHLMIHGWFIPGVLPNGQQTTQRALIMVHGSMQNRADPAAGLLDLAGALAHRGFAVLLFDMRGEGESSPAPWSLGYFEQRDALGAVDFLRSGPLPYPTLGRPRAIGGWGVSMGAITIMLAAAREPAIQAVVSDSGYPDIAPILEREIPKQGGVPAFLTPGALTAVRALYGIDFYNVKPGAVVASIAPRPLFFIQGAADTFNPPSNMNVLVRDAEAAPNADVQSWMVARAAHAQAFHVAGAEYVARVVSFYTAALGPDTNG